MILTGIAKEDFLKWVSLKYEFTEMSVNYVYPKSMQHAFIIEWFDSVGIYVSIGHRLDYDCWTLKVETLTGSDYERGYISRHEATKQAILKANRIYNENTPRTSSK